MQQDFLYSLMQIKQGKETSKDYDRIRDFYNFITTQLVKESQYAEELNEVSGGANHPAYTHFINHTVVKGDNLHSIARLYGSDWRSIYNANRDKIKDPDLIQNGWVLRVPVV